MKNIFPQIICNCYIFQLTLFKQVTKVICRNYFSESCIAGMTVAVLNLLHGASFQTAVPFKNCQCIQIFIFGSLFQLHCSFKNIWKFKFFSKYIFLWKALECRLAWVNKNYRFIYLIPLEYSDITSLQWQKVRKIKWKKKNEITTS